MINNMCNKILAANLNKKFNVSHTYFFISFSSDMISHTCGTPSADYCKVASAQL
jgi:purine nucleoside permease